MERSESKKSSKIILIVVAIVCVLSLVLVCFSCAAHRAPVTDRDFLYSGLDALKTQTNYRCVTTTVTSDVPPSETDEAQDAQDAQDAQETQETETLYAGNRVKTTDKDGKVTYISKEKTTCYGYQETEFGWVSSKIEGADEYFCATEALFRMNALADMVPEDASSFNADTNERVWTDIEGTYAYGDRTHETTSFRVVTDGNVITEFVEEYNFNDGGTQKHAIDSFKFSDFGQVTFDLPEAIDLEDLTRLQQAKAAQIAELMRRAQELKDSRDDLIARMNSLAQQVISARSAIIEKMTLLAREATGEEAALLNQLTRQSQNALAQEYALASEIIQQGRDAQTVDIELVAQFVSLARETVSASDDQFSEMISVARSASAAEAELIAEMVRLEQEAEAAEAEMLEEMARLEEEAELLAEIARQSGDAELLKELERLMNETI